MVEKLVNKDRLYAVIICSSFTKTALSFLRQRIFRNNWDTCGAESCTHARSSVYQLTDIQDKAINLML
jgi:hypothetical protein